MLKSISVLKRHLDELDYKDIQYLPARQASRIGDELHILKSFLLKDDPSLFQSSSFYKMYMFHLKTANAKLYILYNALFQCAETPVGDLLSVFNGDELRLFVEDGIASRAGDRYRFNLRLVPIEDLLIASSPSQDIHKPDYTHIGYDTLFLWRFLKKELRNKRFERALEIGCGAGALSLWLSRLATRVTATDINQKALDITGLNASINGIGNIKTAASDIYSNIKERYDLIISNPPFEFLPENLSGLQHAYGGHFGMAITVGILAGLDEHLTESGSLYILALSYITESGADPLKDEIGKLFEGKPFAVTMMESQYYTNPIYRSFYAEHRISHSIGYIIKIQRAEHYELTTIPLRGISRLKELLRLKISPAATPRRQHP